MYPRVRAALTIFISFGLLAAFAYMFGKAISQTLANDDPPSFSEQYLYVATGLASFVSGVVAVAFGQPPPNPQDQGNEQNQGGLGARVSRLGGLVYPRWRPDWRLVTGSIYALVYAVVGGAALYAVVSVDGAPDVVKNLASIALGLFVAIATTYLRPT